MCGGELFLELVPKIFPVQELAVAGVFGELLPPEDAGSPLGCSPRFHVGNGPHYFGLVVAEFFQTEADVGLTGV